MLIFVWLLPLSQFRKFLGLFQSAYRKSASFHDRMTARMKHLFSKDLFFVGYFMAKPALKGV
jgi:hypothetical protein